MLPERGQWVAGKVQPREVIAGGLQSSLFSHGLMAVRYRRATWPISEHVKLVRGHLGLWWGQALPWEGLQLPRDAGEPTATVIANTEALLALFSTARQVILATVQCLLATPSSGTSLSS